MKIGEAFIQSAISSGSSELSAGERVKSNSGTDGFADLLKKSGNEFEELQKFQGQLMSKSELQPRELLTYQILASQFALKVEVVSKAAESISATLRKYQQGG